MVVTRQSRFSIYNYEKKKKYPYQISGQGPSFYSAEVVGDLLQSNNPLMHI
jgi:hypothetical protein